MTVADLITELQRQPQHKPVRVVSASVVRCDEAGDFEIDLDEHDADTATRVRDMGSYILIDCE